MVIKGDEIFVYSIKQQRWKAFKSRNVYVEYNKLINISGRIIFFEGTKVMTFNKLTKELNVINSMVNELTFYDICAFGSNEIAIAGGSCYNDTSQIYETLSSCYVYEISSNRFIRIADLNVSRKGCSLVNVCGDLYCIGGHDNNSYLSSIEKYDRNNNKWELLDVRLLVARGYHQSVAHESLIITLGGSYKCNGLSNSIEIYNTELKNTTLIKTNLRVPRDMFGCCKKNSTIFIIMGSLEKSTVEEVEILDITDPYKPVVNKGGYFPAVNHINTSACTF